MTHEPTSQQDAAARLLQALDAPDELSCEEARTQLPALVEAEIAGVDVDAAPEYAALLRHLDRCEDCAELYAQLADDLEALTGDVEDLPLTQLTVPAYFKPVRQSEGIILRVLGGLKRRFELTLALPSLVPEVATLGGGKHADLFTDTLPELAGAPLVSVSLLADAGQADMLVAVREPAAQTRWQVRLVAGDNMWTATTDDQGVARFSGLPVGDAHDVTVSCTEVSG